MSRFVIKRLIQGAITIFIVTSIIWMLFEALPGDPATKFAVDPRLRYIYPVIRAEFGLDAPWYVRFFIYLKNMFTLNFGTSYIYNRPVVDLLAQAVPRTLLLFGGSLVIEYALGIVIGSFIGWRRGGLAEGATIVTSLFTYNMPSFWIGIIFLSVFYLQLGWFPSGGFETIVEGQTLTGFAHVVDVAWHLALPMSVLVLINVAGTILLMRTSLLEVMGEDYILTAKAKGLTERAVRRRHANRNAYLPIVTSFTIALAFAIGGAIILESIFSFFGVGYYFLLAILNQDQFLAGATLYIIALFVVFGNIIADLTYAWLDPRVRL
jgi:peptide/nickel transport system permease protein